MNEPKIHTWIKTTCGRSKFAELAAKPGMISRIRLGWFVIVASIRDFPISAKDQIEDSED